MFYYQHAPHSKFTIHRNHGYSYLLCFALNWLTRKCSETVFAITTNCSGSYEHLAIRIINTVIGNGNNLFYTIFEKMVYLRRTVGSTKVLHGWISPSTWYVFICCLILYYNCFVRTLDLLYIPKYLENIP